MQSIQRSAPPCLARYTKLPDAVIDVLTPREHQVLHLLLSHRWTDDGLIYPSVTTMAQRLRCSDRTIQRTIRQLEARGYIVVEAQHRVDKSQQSNLYRPGPMLLPLLPPLGDGSGAGQANDRHPPVTRVSGKRDSGNQQNRTRSRQSAIPTHGSAYLESRRGPIQRR